MPTPHISVTAGHLGPESEDVFFFGLCWSKVYKSVCEKIMLTSINSRDLNEVSPKKISPLKKVTQPFLLVSFGMFVGPAMSIYYLHL